MNLILLGGNSVTNKSWVEKLQQNLGNLFDQTRILYYDHWGTGDPIINLPKELPKLIALTQNFSPYVILAKSFGVILAMRAVADKKITPEKCIFLGSAVISGRSTWRMLDIWSKDFSLPTLFINKTDDPVISAASLRSYITAQNIQNYQFIELPGTDHEYDDLEKLHQLIKNFVQ